MSCFRFTLRMMVIQLSLYLVVLVPIGAFAPSAAGGETQSVPAAAEPETELPPQARLVAPGPEQGGLASLCPGDEGIERDPRVLFVDDFETGTMEEIGARWGNITKPENFRVSADLHGNSPGSR